MRIETLEHLASYYGMISHLDAQVGMILDALETNRVEDNTIIVFTSASGFAVGSHGLRGDQNLYDHRWKLIYYPQINRYQLFNLRNDPNEMDDQFLSSENGRDINRLRIQLSAWQSSVDDSLR